MDPLALRNVVEDVILGSLTSGWTICQHILNVGWDSCWVKLQDLMFIRSITMDIFYLLLDPA